MSYGETAARQQSRWMWCDYQTHCAALKWSAHHFWGDLFIFLFVEPLELHIRQRLFWFSITIFFCFSSFLSFFSFGTFWCTCQQLVYQIHHTLTHTHYRKSISFSSSAADAAAAIIAVAGWTSSSYFFFPRVSFVIFWSRHRIEMWG